MPSLSAPASSELHDKLDRYLTSNPEQVTDVCQWWYERRVAYPRLHRMALDYLTIPGAYFNEVQLSSSNVLIFLVWKLATSDDVEQVFSQGRIVLSHLRSRLSVQTMRALMCLGAWSRLGFVKDRDIKAVVILPDILANMKEDDLAVGWDTIFT